VTNSVIFIRKKYNKVVEDHIQNYQMETNKVDEVKLMYFKTTRYRKVDEDHIQNYQMETNKVDEVKLMYYIMNN
jgi:hypothetical protein